MEEIDVSINGGFAGNGIYTEEIDKISISDSVFESNIDMTTATKHQNMYKVGRMPASEKPLAIAQNFYKKKDTNNFVNRFINGKSIQNRPYMSVIEQFDNNVLLELNDLFKKSHMTWNDSTAFDINHYLSPFGNNIFVIKFLFIK